MANEIKLRIGMERRHTSNTTDAHTYNGSIATYSVTQTGVGQDDRKHTIGTTEETITFTDISTNGFVILENMDTTNYVEWGFATGVYGGRMKATEPAGPFRLNTGATLYLKANTAACRVRICHYEN